MKKKYKCKIEKDKKGWKVIFSKQFAKDLNLKEGQEVIIKPVNRNQIMIKLLKR